MFFSGDIIIERWIPYGAQAKRKTIVQRAEGAKDYPKPRNIIIIYEPIQVRVVRQFQRLGITQENPQVYIQRYGATLLDPQTLVQQARAAGVIEDIVRFSRAIHCIFSRLLFRHHQRTLRQVQDLMMQPMVSKEKIAIPRPQHHRSNPRIKPAIHKQILDYQVSNHQKGQVLLAMIACLRRTIQIQFQVKMIPERP